jgi:hypothetical protein
MRQPAKVESKARSSTARSVTDTGSGLEALSD